MRKKIGEIKHMVQHKWIESKLIYLERNDKERQQDKQMQQAFLNLLKIYHTGRFLTMSDEDIQKELKVKLKS